MELDLQNLVKSIEVRASEELTIMLAPACVSHNITQLFFVKHTLEINNIIWAPTKRIANTTKKHCKYSSIAQYQT